MSDSAEAQSTMQKPADLPSSDTKQNEEYIMEGMAVSRGIAIGPAYVYIRDTLKVSERLIEQGNIQNEITRLQEALLASRRQLEKIQAVAREKLGDDNTEIFLAQSMMLEDQAFLDEVEERIRKQAENAAYAVTTVLERSRQLIQASESEYIRERVNDVIDVRDRIVRNLRRGKLVSAIDDQSIVLASNLTAADIILFSRRNILGCATDFGGPTSHVSIMARALGLPAVVGLRGLADRSLQGAPCILDGFNGRLIINPDKEKKEFYVQLQERYADSLIARKKLVSVPALTLDGYQVGLEANLELVEEIDQLAEYGAEGIGLFRTEFLFLITGSLDYDEGRQYELYKRIIEGAAHRRVTFRLLDLGGDKMMPLGKREKNPFLGWRGIRILLDKPDLLSSQIRALLRASAHGMLRIMIPMVTRIEEVRAVKQIIEHEKKELQKQGIPYDDHIPVGVMVEVPAVALQADIFARESDFFSIGTNDLTQYTLAVDRGNERVCDLFDELHPSLLMLIRQTVEAARRNEIPVSLCGEIASDPRAVPVLIGLGVHTLSASPLFLPELKQVIRSMTLEEAHGIAEEVLQAPTRDQRRDIVDRWFRLHDEEFAAFLDDRTVS